MAVDALQSVALDVPASLPSASPADPADINAGVTNACVGDIIEISFDAAENVDE